MFPNDFILGDAIVFNIAFSSPCFFYGYFRESCICMLGYCNFKFLLALKDHLAVGILAEVSYVYCLSYP